MYIISLLKLLLAAAPTANKSDIFMQDQSGPHSIQLEGTQLFKLPVMLISLDVSRHKEIVTKAIVGFILLLMKHLKNNHINQFEYLSHHLYGSNCFPLIAKFFNQNMTMFVTQRNQIPKLDLRNAIRGLPVIQALIERATEDQMPYCWRNMFSSICFLRILVKIMKGKPWRVIWLVKYKATNIFKKTLLVKHGVFQLYVLKVIKLHARFLGRQWRKNNMDVVSGIYGMVRHHLTDDWAFFNAEPDKESSVQEENKITQTCSHFNRIVYLPEYQEWTKTGHIAKFNEIRLPPNFGSQYKAWVDKEVMSVNVDWDQLLTTENGDSVYEHEDEQVNEPAAA